MAIYMWREYQYKIFTISWEEKSDMSSGWTYSDDAAGLTAGSGAFDDFFGYSAVLLNTSGTETATMSQSGGTFTGAMTSLGNITNGDNVMIKFPKRGIKMTKSGSIVTLSITDDPNLSGYQYFAFNSGGLGTYVNRDCLYIGAYKGYYNGTALKSYSGKTGIASYNANTPRINFIQPNQACTYAKANGAGYQSITWYIRCYINALYMMKYGNPDAATVVGPGYVNGSTYQSTGATDGITSATGATNSTKTGRIKLFGLEDRWGNIMEFIEGAKSDGWYGMQTNMGQDFRSGGPINTFDSPSISISSGYFSSIVGDNVGMFAGKGGGSATTYYRNYFATYGSGYTAGAAFEFDSNGLLRTATMSPDSSDNRTGCRLVYLG